MLCELLQGLEGERAAREVEALLRNVASPWRYDAVADRAQSPPDLIGVRRKPYAVPLCAARSWHNAAAHPFRENHGFFLAPFGIPLMRRTDRETARRLAQCPRRCGSPASGHAPWRSPPGAHRSAAGDWEQRAAPRLPRSARRWAGRDPRVESASARTIDREIWLVPDRAAASTRCRDGFRRGP